MQGAWQVEKEGYELHAIIARGNIAKMEEGGRVNMK